MGMSRSLLALRTELNILRTTRLLSVKSESPSVKTFTFDDELCSKARPGQFLMLWIPGVDEIPLSIMDVDGGRVSVSVKEVGDATKHLHGMATGEIVGVRGPFGNCFSESTGRVLLVGGGTGIAPLLFLAKRLATKSKHLAFVMGAKTEAELLFLNALNLMCTEKSVIATTEDGTFGLQCLVTEPLGKLLAKEKFEMMYSCGPELMVRKIFDIAEKFGVPFEASLERLMRCGIGLCGSCVVGKYRVCRDGPVFNAAKLGEMKDELGISKLGFDGSRIPV
jgi:dihydroorotate dehydrogenase electron transfer subunit